MTDETNETTQDTTPTQEVQAASTPDTSAPAQTDQGTAASETSSASETPAAQEPTPAQETPAAQEPTPAQETAAAPAVQETPAAAPSIPAAIQASMNSDSKQLGDDGGTLPADLVPVLVKRYLVHHRMSSNDNQPPTPGQYSLFLEHARRQLKLATRPTLGRTQVFSSLLREFITPEDTTPIASAAKE
jgi:hypothetical protein